MVSDGKSCKKIDDLEVPPFQETPTYPFFNDFSVPEKDAEKHLPPVLFATSFRAWFIFTSAPRMEFYQEALEMFEKGLEKEPGRLRFQLFSTLAVIFFDAKQISDMSVASVAWFTI